MDASTSPRELEYMQLAPGVGQVPEKFRNGAYAKLSRQAGYEIKPGSLGIGNLLKSREDSTLTKGEFLAAMKELVAGLTTNQGKVKTGG